ncbi:MAG: S8 family serine peptidase, partial [Pseudomonadota bacterium]
MNRYLVTATAAVALSVAYQALKPQSEEAPGPRTTIAAAKQLQTPGPVATQQTALSAAVEASTKTATERPASLLIVSPVEFTAPMVAAPERPSVPAIPAPPAGQFHAVSQPEQAELVVSYKADSFDAIARQVNDLGGEIIRQFGSLNMVEVRLPTQTEELLLASNEVIGFSANDAVAAMSRSARATVNLPSASSPNAFPASNFGVAVLDSGVAQHSDLDVEDPVEIIPATNALQRFDSFASNGYEANEGDALFNWRWNEDHDDNSPHSGDVRLVYDPDHDYVARLKVDDGYTTLSRLVNLDGARTAYLSFDWRAHHPDGARDGMLDVWQWSANAGWSVIYQFPIDKSTDFTNAEVDLTPYIAEETNIGFGFNGFDGQYVEIDNVAVVSTQLSGGFSDRFDNRSYSNQDGVMNWSYPWEEDQDDNHHNRGDVRLVSDGNGGFFARLGHSPDWNALKRAVNLSGVQSVTLRFDWRGTAPSGSNNQAGVDIWGWSNQHGWTPLDRVYPQGNSDWTTLVVDASQFAGEHYVQFGFSAWNMVPGQSFDLDNVSVDVDVASSSQHDGFGHGTHVAGVISGKGDYAPSQDFKGVAPGAKIHPVRVLDSTGRGTVAEVISGLEWVLENADDRNIRVVNLSLGKPITESAETDPLVQAVERVWDAGITVVVSAG